ncbi:SIS domain-containing protein [Gemmatimonadota bacterium]
MSDLDIIRGHLEELKGLADTVSDTLAPQVGELADLVRGTLDRGGRLFFCGNGGSAADAQHLAAEYLVRFARNRRALPALALTTDSSVLTAGANDLGFEWVFARQVEALAREGDLLFLHSTSGESENLLQAAEAASARRVGTVAFLAKGGGRLAAAVDHALVVPTQSTARAQEMHLALGHIICELVEARLAEGDGSR